MKLLSGERLLSNESGSEPPEILDPYSDPILPPTRIRIVRPRDKLCINIARLRTYEVMLSVEET